IVTSPCVIISHHGIVGPVVTSKLPLRLSPLAGWPLVVGGASAHRRPSCGKHDRSRPPTCGLLPVAGVRPLAGGLGYSRLGHGWLVMASHPSSQRLL
ncbi:hypothetical protein B296_00008683, partial [Ensete ventricosum]